MATLNRITDKEPAAPLDKLIAECSPALSAAIATALEKDENKRFQNMTDMARALERALTESSAADQRAEPPARSRRTPPPSSTTRTQGAWPVRALRIGDRSESQASHQ